MKIEKNSFLSCTSQPLPHQGRLHQSMTIGLGFDLVRNVVIPADQAWAAAIENLPESWCIDSGFPKKYAEWLLAGSARTAEKALQSELTVEIEVGASKRSFSIRGSYQEDGALSLFSSMPLVWENTFGYSGSPDNPLGRGEMIGKNGRVYLPEVCDAQDALSTPACPGSRGAWPCRMGNMGTYDASWLTRNWPGLPDDCDGNFCNLAQPAQYMPAGLRGDEALRLTGLHHEHPILFSRLPGKNLRIFVDYAGTDTSWEVIPSLDTLWLFPDNLTGLLLWHVLIPSRDESATDITCLRLEMSPPESEPLSEFLSESPQNISKDRQAPYESPKAEWRRLSHDTVGRDMSLVPANESAGVHQAFTDALETLEAVWEQPEMDVSIQERWMIEGDFSGQDLVEKDFSGMNLSGADFSNAKLTGARFVGSVLRDADFSGADMAGVDVSRADLSGASLQGATLTGGVFCDAHIQDAIFIEADLSQANMIGVRATGVDFTGCVMEGIILCQADCGGANFTGVRAAGMDARNADLSKACLRASDFCNAIFTDAVLRESDICSSIFNAAVFQNADCTKATFWGTTAALNCDFSQAVLAESEWEGVQADGSSFIRVQANGARFIACGFTRTSWKASLAMGADFSRSTLDNAELRGANLFNASFRESVLQGADCTGANLYGVDFYRCAFDGATRIQDALLGKTLLTLMAR